MQSVALHRMRGFSLIEMIVGLGIMLALLLVTVPNVRSYMTDSRIRAAAQAYYSAAQLARAEAVRRNSNVQIVLTNVPNASPPEASMHGLGWAVLAGSELVDSQAPRQLSASALQVQADVAVVDFDSSGASSVRQTVKFSDAASDSCYPDGPRCLHILISRGGQVRLCDPAVSGNDDNRKC